MSSKLDKSLAGTGIIAAFAASLCCIVPALAMLAGLGGAASSVSWMEPLRPYLIGLTVVVLGYAWFLKLRPKKAETDACGCSTSSQKISFMQSKKFLGILSIFSALMLTFPYYSSLFYATPQNNAIVISAANLVEAQINIKGMTCGGCENHVSQALLGQQGVASAGASYTAGNADVKFDRSKTSLEELCLAIEKETGYEVLTTKIINPR